MGKKKSHQNITIVTAGNKPFKRVLSFSKKQADSLGYKMVIFDLGGLGFGIPSEVVDDSFHSKGYYQIISGTWKTKAIHKPDIIKKSLSSNDWVAYLDGDAVPFKNFDEIIGDYDIGVTVRRPEELELETIASHREVMGWVNAGVIFFNNNHKTRIFIEKWYFLTNHLKNDQLALNRLINPDNKPLKWGESWDVNGVRVKSFSTNKYNFYYFDENASAAKIVHYRNNEWNKLISFL